MQILPKSVSHKVVIAIVIQTTLISVTCEDDAASEFLNNLKLTHWDDWGVNTTCPRNLYVIGLKAKTVEVDGQTSVNGFQIICSDEINLKNKATRSAYLGRPTGDWELVKKCTAGFVVGILSILTPTDISFPGSSIQSLQIYCSDESREEAPNSMNGENGTKHQRQFCDTGDAVVGITVKADSIITVKKGDSAAVKNVLMECRSVTNPANHRQIEYGWEKRKGKMKCLDTNGSNIVPELSNAIPLDHKSKTISMNCSYESWTGVGLNPNLHRASHAIDVYSSMGLNNNKDFVKWALLRRIMSTDSRRWFLQKFPTQPRLLNDFAEEMLAADVKNYTESFPYKIPRYPIPSNLFKRMRADPNSKLVLRHDPMFEQFVGNCGMYQIAFSLFRAAHHVYIETLVNKRTTRIVFNEFDMASMKKDRK